MDIRNIKNLENLITYFAENLNWRIDFDDFEEIDDITYDFDAADIGLKEEAFVKIASLRQLQPLCDEQKWGIFCVEFDSNKFEVSALRKILSGLIPKRRNAAEHAVWKQKDLLFLCFWGRENERTIGIAHFEDKETGLPQIKMISCAPAVEDFTQISKFEENLSKLTWVKNESDTEAWYAQWSSAFVTAYHQVIRDSASLTVKLAAEAQAIRNRILDIYAVENSKGYVHKLFKDFKDALIHDMTKEQFADMYAQTVVYGLFSARCMDKTQDGFDVEEAISCIPNTNPFLKRLMEECLGKNSERHLTFDELEVANVVDVLTNTNTELILKDFNRQTGGGREDPVIHFYEEFLTAYDKGQKIDRGVFYTPQPIVNFIVRAVDSILKTEFGLADGLASEETKTVKYRRDSMKKNSDGMITQVEDTKEVPAVQILDPATGTGTFLRQTILQIYDNFRAKHKGESEEQIKAAWNEYVPKHLLPRLNGFELMMAPYAVAHMKLAMVLKDTGYEFDSNQRLNVFLTNSLEEAGKDDFQMTFFDNDPLAFEAIEANQAKKNNGINVIIGNPPYNSISVNDNPFIRNLLMDYKVEPGGVSKLKEKKTWIDDDYVKFIRLSEAILNQHGQGVLAFINPHGWLEHNGFRGMRWHLLRDFDEIFILNLHGNTNFQEKCPDGSKDENVFGIRQGVCINIFVRHQNHSSQPAKVKYCDIYGIKSDKYSLLYTLTMDKCSWKEITPLLPSLYLLPIDFSNSEIYDSGFSLTDLFLLSSQGVMSGNDQGVIFDTEQDASETIMKLLEYESVNDAKAIFYKNYSPPKNWNFEKAMQDLKNGFSIIPITYRPFETKYSAYTGRSCGWMWRPRTEVMSCFEASIHNLALVCTRVVQQGEEYHHVFISDKITDKGLLSSKDNAFVFPLRLIPSKFEENTEIQNFNSEIIKKIESILNLQFNNQSYVKRTSSFVDLDLFDYIYAVLYSNNYRTTYNEALKKKFPRIPYPKNKEEFWRLVEIGSRLRECHLMHTEFDISPYDFIGDGTNEVVKPEYKNGRVYISKTKYFDNVPQAQWEQYIGGYQPLQKWLKDRKKTMLSAEDIEHYKKIIAALKLTEELMAEIDMVVKF